MPQKASLYTQVALEIADEMGVARQAASKAQPVPVMEEQLAPHELKQRLMRMSPEGRRAYWQRIGMDKAMQGLQPRKRG